MKSQKHDDNTTRIAVLETTINHIDASLINIIQDIRALSSKFDTDIKELRHEISEDIKEIRQEGRSNFRWLMGFLISFFVGTFGVITAFILKTIHFI